VCAGLTSRGDLRRWLSRGRASSQRCLQPLSHHPGRPVEYAQLVNANAAAGPVLPWVINGDRELRDAFGQTVIGGYLTRAGSSSAGNAVRSSLAATAKPIDSVPGMTTFHVLIPITNPSAVISGPPLLP
jgi:hypothetical protein